MEGRSLTEVTEQLLTQAEDSHSGRAAQTVYGGHDRVLRQTVIALAAEHALAEHESPGEATLQVLVGRVSLTAGDDAHRRAWPETWWRSRRFGTRWRRWNVPRSC